jgi:hypothetical protein
MLYCSHEQFLDPRQSSQFLDPRQSSQYFSNTLLSKSNIKYILNIFFSILTNTQMPHGKKN